jgi:hypothetical protein
MTEENARKVDAEIAKLIAESSRLNAEVAKISAETMKIATENRWYPAVVGAGFMAAAVALAKLLLT